MLDHSHATQLDPAVPSTHTDAHLAVKMSPSDSPTHQPPTGPSSSPGQPLSGSTGLYSTPATPPPEPTPPPRRRPSSSSFLPDSSFITPSSPNRPESVRGENPLPPQTRRDRHRSAIEFRSGRLSGFFTNLMHRRDPVPSPLSSRTTFRDDGAQHSPPPLSSAPPHLPPRVVTPPPQLPPPTLRELGLSLSVVTADLSPSHFSTPPWSGTFLEPHYLLLCHAQGLDVLPLVSPPAPQPYALVRRVSFKSVVVMEHRGVLVAIAGRRDGVRVYALEDVKKVVEWRMDFEVRRERERMRREAAKKASPLLILEPNGKSHRQPERKPKARLSTPSSLVSMKMGRKASHEVPSDSIPPTPSSKKTVPPVTVIPEPSGLPPPYVGPSDSTRPSSDSTTIGDQHGPFVADGKGDWQECSSDEEAINVVAAGASGSQALDERTSAMHSSSASIPAVITTETRSFLTPTQSSPLRRNRPANLDLSLSRAVPTAMNPPSPTPTLITLRQALSQQPPCAPVDSPHADIEDDDDEDGGISLVQALLESRLPDLPPVGTRCPQEPILITPSYTESNLPRSNASDLTPTQNNARSIGRRRRRRWSVLDGGFSNGTRNQSTAPSTTQDPPTRSLFRSHSNRSRNSDLVLNSTQPATAVSSITPNDGRSPTPTPTITPSRSKFFTRIFGNALNPRRSEEDVSTNPPQGTDDEGAKSGITPSPAPPPKLEYVKLPGTKGAVLVKAVETLKKSFLAILCGENGEKVELFAGTYRTALGLSRTFILPDSPRSLELQLQGDDLVEIFLVFNQNIFGLEPATVRVREVRIGRAERRAARRRARGHRHGDVANDTDNHALHDEDSRLNVGVTVSVGSNVVASGDGVPMSPLPSPSFEDAGGGETITTSYLAHDDLGAFASAQAGPYTTFQQLSFAPSFPLASIADDYIIPPTYLDFLQYRTEHEPEVDGSVDLARIQFTPPGLPLPVSTPPSRWFYRDPKGVVHGPWKASLMQVWYKDSLLPPDLPVRTEGETEFTLLKDLRLQCVDPSHPFRSSPPAPHPEITTCMQDPAKPLLKPTSLLSQPKHFGPPALFFSSRGGHSTTIVDSRGKSVLKSRFLWSGEPDDDSKGQTIRMGDVKRLEAFDVEDRAVLVAMRQGGLEAMDLGDALLRPADESRTVLPQFWSSQSNTSRRDPFVWRIGTPVSSSPTSSTVLCSNGSQAKKQIASTRSYASKLDLSPESDDAYDEILFLGRKNDDIYMCERSAGSFRILRLCPL